MKILEKSCNSTLAMNKITFILVEPAYPSNMGAVARSLAATGFTDYRIVAPQRDPHGERAVKNARSGLSLLKSALVYRDLAEAISDLDLVIGTTRNQAAPKGRIIPHYSAELLHEKLCSCYPHQRIGLLFGTESRGLTKDQLSLCQMTSYIPTDAAKGSLNLAQALMVFAYKFSRFDEQDAAFKSPPPPLKPAASLAVLRRKLEDSLSTIGLPTKKINWIKNKIHEIPPEDRVLLFDVINHLNLVDFPKSKRTAPRA